MEAEEEEDGRGGGSGYVALRSKGEGEGVTPVPAGPHRVEEEESVEARGGEARAVTHGRERKESAAWRGETG